MTFLIKSLLLNKGFYLHELQPMTSQMLLLVMSLLLYWWYRRPAKSPPGPRGLPLIGVAPMLANEPQVVLNEWSKHYGPVMSVRIGRSDWVFLNNAKAVKEAFIKQGTKLSNRPPNYFTDQILSRGRNGILFSDGAVWNSLKRFGVAALRRVESGRKCYEDAIQNEALFLTEKLSKFEGYAFDISPHLMGATANVISTILRGFRMNDNSKEFADLCDMTSRFVLDPQRTRLANAVIFCPTLRFLPMFRKIVRQGIADTECMEEYMKSTLLLNNQRLHEGKTAKSFIQAFFAQRDSETNPRAFSDINLMYLARDMLLAGTETTTVTLLWCILAVVRDPRLQTDLQKEIDNFFQISCSNELEYRLTMPLVCSFIDEIHRYCPAAPLALPHMASDDAAIGGYRISKGSTVVVNFWSVHRDQSEFEAPEDFDPRRFINHEGLFRKSASVIPFSIGPRSCFGEKIAKSEVFVFLCFILKTFTISSADKKKLPKLNDGILSTTYTPKPFQILLSKR